MRRSKFITDEEWEEAKVLNTHRKILMEAGKALIVQQNKTKITIKKLSQAIKKINDILCQKYEV